MGLAGSDERQADKQEPDPGRTGTQAGLSSGEMQSAGEAAAGLLDPDVHHVWHSRLLRGGTRRAVLSHRQLLRGRAEKSERCFLTAGGSGWAELVERVLFRRQRLRGGRKTLRVAALAGMRNPPFPMESPCQSEGGCGASSSVKGTRRIRQRWWRHVSTTCTGGMRGRPGLDRCAWSISDAFAYLRPFLRDV